MPKRATIEDLRHQRSELNQMTLELFQNLYEMPEDEEYARAIAIVREYQTAQKETKKQIKVFRREQKTLTSRIARRLETQAKKTTKTERETLEKAAEMLGVSIETLEQARKTAQREQVTNGNGGPLAGWAVRIAELTN